MKKYLAAAGLLLVTLIWGGGFVASDIALDNMQPFQILTIRFFLAAVCMGIPALKHLKHTTGKEIRAGICMGAAVFTGFAFQIVGLQYTTPSKNAFLTALNVVFVPFLSFIFLKKKVGIKACIGAVLSVTGAAVLSLNGDFSLGLGDVLTVAGAAAFAVQIFLTGEFVKKYRVSVLNFVQMAAAFVFSFAGMLAAGEKGSLPSVEGVLSVLYLGFLSTMLCYLLQTACQKYVDETKAAIILSMESVFGTLFSILILKEMVTLRMSVGCLLILAAVLIVNTGADIE